MRKLVSTGVDVGPGDSTFTVFEKYVDDETSSHSEDTHSFVTWDEAWEFLCSPRPELEARSSKLEARSPLAHAISIAKLALKFSRVERITKHEDGLRPETDSDHVVMLALLACEFAPPGLDSSRIAEFVMVHDLPEADTGDVQTLSITLEERVQKKKREREAAERIRDEFGPLSKIAILLAQYEAQVEPEARYVRLFDKIVPKLTHMMNGCVAARAIVETRQEFAALHRAQYDELAAQYPEFPETLALLRQSMEASEAAWLEEEAEPEEKSK